MMTSSGSNGGLRVRGIAVTALLGGVVLPSLVVAGWSAALGTQPMVALARTAESATMQTVEAREGATALVTYTGDVKPKAQVVLTSKTMGRIEELGVDIGSRVKASDVIGRLDRASLEAQLKQAEAAVAVAKAKMAQMEAGTRAETIGQAEANLNSLKEKLAAAQEGGRKEAIAQAEAGLSAAQARLAELKAGPTPEQIEQAEASVRAAKNQLYATQAQADAQIGSGRAIFTKEMKEAESGAAYEQINIAQARLAELKAGPTKDQLDQARAAVDQAKATLEMARNPLTGHDVRQIENAVSAAEQQVKLAQTPFTKYDFDVADASVAQAQANVEVVKAQLAETNLVAPMDGVVAEKLLSVGALVGPQIPILEMISSDLEIALPIEEAWASRILVGQPVSFTVAAFPNESFAGTITSVAPAINTRSRTFTAKVAVQDGEGKLKAGMLATVSIAFGEER